MNQLSNQLKPKVKPFFDEATNTFSYVISDPQSHACAIVDSVLDFDYASGRTDTRSADSCASPATPAAQAANPAASGSPRPYQAWKRKKRRMRR